MPQPSPSDLWYYGWSAECANRECTNGMRSPGLASEWGWVFWSVWLVSIRNPPFCWKSKFGHCFLGQIVASYVWQWVRFRSCWIFSGDLLSWFGEWAADSTSSPFPAANLVLSFPGGCLIIGMSLWMSLVQECCFIVDFFSGTGVIGSLFI